MTKPFLLEKVVYMYMANICISYPMLRLLNILYILCHVNSINHRFLIIQAAALYFVEVTFVDLVTESGKTVTKYIPDTMNVPKARNLGMKLLGIKGIPCVISYRAHQVGAVHSLQCIGIDVVKPGRH